MWALSFASVVLGISVGFRFRIHVLVVVVGLELFAAVLAGLVLDQDVWAIAARCSAIAISAQLGYLAGSFAGVALTPIRLGQVDAAAAR